MSEPKEPGQVTYEAHRASVLKLGDWSHPWSTLSPMQREPWIAAERKAKADAWDEGFEAGGWGYPVDHAPPSNPYRSKTSGK